MAKPPPSRDEVIRWARATGNESSPAAIARQFPMLSPNTIKSWLRRAKEDGRIPTAPPNLVSLPTPEPAPRAAEPLDEFTELDKLAGLPIRDLLRRILLLRLARLALRVDAAVESVADSVKIIASLADRLTVLEQLEPVKELDPSTEEGRAALRAALDAFPAEVRAEIRAYLVA
jgi:transposase-like protein